MCEIVTPGHDFADICVGESRYLPSQVNDCRDMASIEDIPDDWLEVLTAQTKSEVSDIEIFEHANNDVSLVRKLTMHIWWPLFGAKTTFFHFGGEEIWSLEWGAFNTTDEAAFFRLLEFSCEEEGPQWYFWYFLIVSES